MRISIIYYTYKKNNKSNLLDEDINFVDLKKKQNRYFKLNRILIAIITILFFIFCVI